MKKWACKTAFLGTGRLAGSLARISRPSGIWGRDIDKTGRLAEECGCGAYGSPLEALDESDLVLVAVSDSALPDIVDRILQGLAGKRRYDGKLVAHTSGSVGPEILQPLSDAGIRTGKIHPMFPFSSDHTPFPAHVVFGIEAPEESSLETLEEYARFLSGIPVRIFPEGRLRYHLAGVFASNFVMAMLSVAEQMVRTSCPGIQPADLITPLVEGTLQNYSEHGPDRGVTGPAHRGESKIIDMHLSELARIDSRIENIYRSTTVYLSGSC